MVARGEGEVARTGCLDGHNPCLGIEARGIKGCGSLGILGLEELAAVEIPFFLPVEAIDAPVQEYAQTVVRKALTGRKIGR